MWIRSQDGRKLVNCNQINCTGVILDGKRCWCINGGITDDGAWTLGIYETEEIAIEVLDAIQEKFISSSATFFNSNDVIYKMP